MRALHPCNAASRLILVVLILSSCSEDPNSSDKAYCALFAKRIDACFPLSRERTVEQEAARCLGGRTMARKLGQWDDSARRELVQCLSKQSCDEVSDCMHVRRAPKPPR